MSESDGLDHRGGCSCGWLGPWRLTDAEAHEDMHEHHRQTRCQLTTFEFKEAEDDLMPFERAKHKDQGASEGAVIMKILVQQSQDPRYSLLERRIQTLGELLLSRGLVTDHPGNNSGVQFKNTSFTMNSYYWGDCDCGMELTDEEYDLIDNGERHSSEFHKPECLEDAPNFVCQELKVWWYKNLGRAMDSNILEEEIINNHGGADVSC